MLLETMTETEKQIDEQERWKKLDGGADKMIDGWGASMKSMGNRAMLVFVVGCAVFCLYQAYYVFSVMSETDGSSQLSGDESSTGEEL